MAANVTLLAMRDRVRKRADMENSNFFTDAQITTELNVSLRWLYNLLVECYGADYYVSSTTDASASGTATYALPADFFKLLGLGVTQDGTRYVALRRFARSQRNTRPNQATYLRDYRYRLEGSNYRIIPTPPTGLTFKIIYVPTFTDLSNDSDPFDGINGFEEWAVLDTAIKLLQAEESEWQYLATERDRIEQMIRADAEARDLNEQHQVVDLDEIPLEEDFEGFFL